MILAFVIFLVPFGTAQTFTVLHAFTGSPDGAGPATLMWDQGVLFGTTEGGGTNGSYCVTSGCGTLFTVDSAHHESVVSAFATINIDKGYAPWVSNLARDGAGNFYGVTLFGGGVGCSFGCGTVFKVSPKGKQTVVYRFTGANGDGEQPQGLARDAAGNLYGTTSGGGEFKAGTVFKIDSAGNETVLHSFGGVSGDGVSPVVGVVLDPDNNIYGTTFFGGTYANGTIFKVNSTGVETVLYSFGGSAFDGFEDEGSLLLDSAGNLYGTTAEGGDLSCNAGGGCGVVYKLDPLGNYTVLYNFTDSADGAFPQTGLAIDGAGNLYGTTRGSGGANTCGTVFKLAPSGVLTPLHVFTGCGEDGVTPAVAPVLDGAGNIYGATAGGGIINSLCPYGCGLVFKITP